MLAAKHAGSVLLELGMSMNANPHRDFNRRCQARQSLCIALFPVRRSGDSMTLKTLLNLSSTALVMTLAACQQADNPKSEASRGSESDRAITQRIANDADGKDWLSYGRTYSEDHYSPLTQIDTSNVPRLNLAWSYDMDVLQRNDAQPLEANGVLYVAAGLSIIHAFDVRTGKLLWRYDSVVTPVAKQKMRPSWGIRGLSLWGDKVIFGTQDGRLIALNAKSGKEVWSTQTLDQQDETTITGAPRVFNGKVVIGYAGAERSKVRGAVSAYDANTGKFLWRFWTVPGDPSKGFENEAMEMAAKTWSGEWWKYGGGGTVWNAMTYDPEFNRLYIGVGNGGPWNWKIRNPKGGDALFLASIVALDADTGKYVWHHQQNPNEAWDYNASMDMPMATLTIDGKPRKVLMQAPKNGFYFVLDRQTGKLISAEKIGRADWAKGYDLKTGRPIENPDIRYEKGPIIMWPGTYGTHNWQPMSYSPKLGLAFIPTVKQADVYTDQGIDLKNWKPRKNVFNSGLGALPKDSKLRVPVETFSSSLQAWDPVRQKQVWSIPNPGVINGGTMVTAGGLVFQGLLDGTLNAYDATNGKRLWKYFAGVAVLGAPITYEVDGKQYVSVVAGPPSGSPASTLTMQAKFGWRYRDHPRRVLTFVLDGKTKLPETPPPGQEKPLLDKSFVVNPALAAEGDPLFNTRCRTCHGTNALASGGGPDLRASAMVLNKDAFREVVSGGALLSRGMPQIDDLSEHELETLRHFIRQQADRKDVAGTGAPGE